MLCVCMRIGPIKRAVGPPVAINDCTTWQSIKLKIEHLEELKRILEESSISLNDVCIVGSSVLAAHGIRKNKDIDIILSKNIRKLFTESDKSFNLTENIECVGVGWLYNLDNRTKDEEIIYNSNKHFVINVIQIYVSRATYL